MGSRAAAVPGTPGVLVLNGCLPPPFGGIATFLSQALPALVASGIPVVALMPRGYSDADYDAYRALGVEVVVPPRRNRVVTALRLAGTVMRYRRDVWQRCVVNRLPLREALVHLCLWLPESEDLLRVRGDGIGIVHAYDAPWAQGWIAAMLARRYGKRFVMSTFGEMAPHSDPVASVDAVSRRYKRFCREILAAADEIVAPSRFCAEKLKFVEIDPQAAALVYPVVGMERFVAASDDALPGGVAEALGASHRRLILFAGQLQPRKGANVLVDAAPRVVERVPEALFVVAGPDHGSLAELQQQSERLGLAGHCMFTGAVTDAELRALYRCADIFVFPTVSDIECLGLAYIQAMYAGCAVVASAISAVPEVIGDGDSGLLFTPGDDGELADQLIRLLSDDRLRVDIARRGQARARQRFDEKAVVDQLIALYTR